MSWEFLLVGVLYFIMSDNHDHRVFKIVFCAESILLIETHSLYALKLYIIGCMSPLIFSEYMLEKGIGRSTWVLQCPHLRLIASMLLGCVQGLCNEEHLRVWSCPSQGIPCWWLSCHSRTSCTTDMGWWQHAYVVFQWNWPKHYHFCFLSSQEETTCNIFWFYLRNAPKLPTQCIHRNTVQLPLALCQLLCWMSRAKQFFHHGW